MTHISEITLLIAVIALALWPVVLFALRFLRERQKRLEYIERMTKDEQDEVTTKDLVISVLKKIGCQPKVNEENHITFKYQGDDFYIAAEEENRFIMIWNPWWGSINADNEALPYLKEIINLANVNSLVTTVYMADEDEKTIGLHSRCHTFFSPREGELEAGTRTDTIIVVALDHKEGVIRMASIYRDTLLQQDDNTYNKANHAYFSGGPKAAINMLNKNLDLDIQDYATVDFKAMSDVVDMLGGIKIQVTDPEAKMLNKYVGETAKASKKKAHKLNGGGVYTLDGPQAVTYARLRKLEGGDYKRTERQRLVIKKLYEKGIKADIGTLNKIVDKIFPQVSTSFSLKEVLSLAAGRMI